MRSLILFGICAAALGVARADDLQGAPVWGNATAISGFDSLAKSPPPPPEKPKPVAKKKSSADGGKAGARSKRFHLENVPKQAWLILMGSFGMLATFFYLRWRGPRGINPDAVFVTSEEWEPLGKKRIER